MEKKEPLLPEMVQAFVGLAHRSLEQVQKLLEQEPMLLNAAWDWGGGDWETALGAAAHMGRRDIALYLLEKGARIDIFAAAMLGNLEIVQALLKAYPQARHALGPHSIPLLQHAKVGGEEAAAVLALLQTQGDA
ncbi:MAG TPA: ankyrin repeat domain-containing protein [Ktedonosporobacter sp.]|nr:ankyrin repeat domain-containing protein [Ktedonosporobacter sp.]